MYDLGKGRGTMCRCRQTYELLRHHGHSSCMMKEQRSRQSFEDCLQENVTYEMEYLSCILKHHVRGTGYEPAELDWRQLRTIGAVTQLLFILPCKLVNKRVQSAFHFKVFDMLHLVTFIHCLHMATSTLSACSHHFSDTFNPTLVSL